MIPKIHYKKETIEYGVKESRESKIKKARVKVPVREINVRTTDLWDIHVHIQNIAIKIQENPTYV